MLTKNEQMEVVEPALYLIISGLPNTDGALNITDRHFACIRAALKLYRSDGNCDPIATEENIHLGETVNNRVRDIQTSPSIGLARLVSCFYFHDHKNAKSANNAITKAIIEDDYISPDQLAIDLIRKILTTAT